MKRRWHFPVPCPPLPRVGRRIRTNWRRHFGPCQSLTSLPYSFWLFISLSLSLRLFPCRAASLQKVYIEQKKFKKSSLTRTPLTCPLPRSFVSLSPVVSPHPLPVSHSHPGFSFFFFLVLLSSPGVNVLFPTVLAVCPTEDPSCSYGNQLATMLGNIIMLAQKEISSPGRVVR